jgi:creatinine amidohydrolase/Fe(II)-dependent formamide hydrolase-like protein
MPKSYWEPVMPVYLLNQLRGSEFRALPRDRTIFLIPVGPIEDHGDALPVALDLAEAGSLSNRTATRLAEDGWNCVLVPAAPLGVDANTAELGIRVRPHVLRDYLVDFCDGLARHGFRYFIALSGNPGPRQLTTIEEAGKFLRKRHLRLGLFPNARAPILVSANSVLLDEAEKSRSSLYMDPKEHGGERDAGVALATLPELVDEKTLRAQPPVEGNTAGFERWREGRAGKISGYWGNPAAGSATNGNSLLDEKAKTLALKFKAGIEGGKPHALFKSWYSLVPTNQSLFKIWILVILLAAVLGGWTLVSLQSFLKGADFN